MADRPSLERFLEQARPLNPGLSDAEITEVYHQSFPTSPTAPGPDFQTFLKEAKPLNPDYTDEQIRQQWETHYGSQGAREYKPGFFESVGTGMRHGAEELGVAGAGTFERLQPDTTLKAFASDVGDTLSKEAEKFMPPAELMQQPWYNRLRDPEGLGHFLGDLLVQSAPSLAGAAVGGLLGGPAGAAAGVMAVTYFQQAGSTYRDAYQRHIADGLSEAEAHDKAYVESGIAGLVSGVVNSLAIPASLMAPFTSTLKNLALQYVSNVAIDTGDQATQNIIAKATYEPEREISAGVPEAVIGSGLLSAPETMATVKSVVTGPAPSTPPGAPPTEPPAPPPIEPIAPIRDSGGAGIIPILDAKSIDEAILKTKQSVEAPSTAPFDVDQFIAQQSSEEVRRANQKLLETMFEQYGQRVERSVTKDELGNTFFGEIPLNVVAPAQLPVTTPPDAGISQEKYRVLSAIADTLGKRIVVFEAQPELPDGMVWASGDPTAIFLSSRTQDADLFSVFSHEAVHLMQGTPFFDALKQTIWEQMNPESKQIAIDRHGELSQEALLDEVVADISGTELHKPEVWESVYRKLQEKAGEEEARNQVVTFIDTIKEMIAKVKALIESRPWSTGFGASRRTHAEQYLNDLTKVHDALSSAVANVIHETRTKTRKEGQAETPAAAKDREKLALSKKSPSIKQIVHPEGVLAFTELAKAQRGAPESAMLKVQKSMGGGVLNPVVEHVGDLTHRMTEMSQYGMAGKPHVQEKVDRSIKALTHAYGFEKEMAENIERNAEYFKKPVRQLRAEVDAALAEYTAEHKKLPVYNLPQWLAREAAVAVGEKRFQDAVAHLKELKAIVESKDYDRMAFEFTRDVNRKIQTYTRPLPAKLIGVQKVEGGEMPDFELYNIERDIPGHPAGSTVTEKTIREAGYRPVPTDLISTTEERKIKKAAKEKREAPPEVKAEPKEKEAFDYSSTQINLPDTLAEKVNTISAQIAEKDFAEKGREDQPHITVKYGLHDKTPEAAKTLLAGEPPVRVTIGKLDVFPATEERESDVLILRVTSEDLDRLNEKITDQLPNTETQGAYKPHITVAYVKPGLGKDYVKSLNNTLEGQSLTLNTIVFSDTEGKQTPIKLTGSRAAIGTPIVNIGLNVNDGSTITPNEALTALRMTGVKVKSQSVQQSGTEPTLVATLNRPLTEAEANSVAVALKQEAIAQRIGETGELYGPGAEKWRPFNPEYFLMPEPQASKKKTARLEHYTTKEGLTEISPKFFGTGQAGAERRRMEQEGGAFLPRSYFYRAGTRPEARFKGLTRYTVDVPADRLVDLATLEGTPTEREQEAKRQGYLGYYNSESSMPEAVALFESVKVGGPQASPVQTIKAYEVYDPRTGEVKGTYNNKKRARNVVDKLDLEYGAVRYSMREIDRVWPPDQETKPQASPKQAPIFYSQAERILVQKMPKNASAAQIKGILSPTNGVKPDELKWIGMDDFLKTKDLFSKQEVLDFVRSNQVIVDETTLQTQRFENFHDFAVREFGYSEDKVDAAWKDFKDPAYAEWHTQRDQLRTPKFAAYQLPGGENYRELLLTFPQYPVDKELPYLDTAGGKYAWYRQGQPISSKTYATREEAMAARPERYREIPSDYQSPHWDIPNVLAHVRFNDRVVDGKKVLFLEEVQSDWHQKGKNLGYAKNTNGWTARLLSEPDAGFTHWEIKDINGDYVTTIVGGSEESAIRKAAEGVPAAPFAKTWHELVMKRMLRYAAENGYDSLAWTTGEQQAERYDLSKQVDRITYFKNTGLEKSYGNDGTYNIRIEPKGAEEDIFRYGLDEKELENFVGKDVAKKIIENAGEGSEGRWYDRKYYHYAGTLRGLDLKVGGEGMKGFYDLILPAFMNKYGKKWGAKVESLKLDIIHPAIGEYEGGSVGDRMARLAVHSIPITDAMKKSVLEEGQPLFSPKATYPVEPPGKLDKVIRVLQNKNIDIQRVVEAIRATGAVIPDELNPVLREEMYQKREQQQAADFTNDELRPLVELMRLNNISLEQLDKYLHARHVIADDVNAKLKALNPTMPNNDALSGMTNQEALSILAVANRPMMERLAKHVDDMVNTTRKLMVDYGLEKQSTIDAWKQTYRAYVPLRREGFEAEGYPTGTGRSVRGSTVRERAGSELAVTSILANIAQARDQIISRGEKQRPVIAMAGLLMLHPNPAIATLDKPAQIEYTDPATGLISTVPGNLAQYAAPTVRRFDPISGTMKFFPDPMYKGRDNVVNFRVEGIDYAIVFNERNERALEVAKAFKNLDSGQLSGIMKAIAPYTRYLAAINTQYNPIFGIVNFIRDAQFAMLTLGSTPLAGKRVDVLNNARKALAGIYQDARAIRAGANPTSQTALMWQRFEHVGGPTGYRDLFFTTEEREKEIRRLLDPKSWSGIRNPQDLGKRMEETPLFQWLSDYNLTMENAIRLGVFQTAVDMGISDIQAASYAKNITVNFNKKGQIGAQMGALYAFFNANVQGTARIAETLFERTPTGVRLSSLGKKIIVGGLLVGVLQTFALALGGFDDDDPPEFVKQKNLIFPIPFTDKRYAMVPMPLGFNLLPTVGRLAAETVRSAISGRPAHPLEKGASMFAALYNALSPTGGSGGIIQELSPTVTDPMMALAANRDWTGRSIYKEDISSLDPTPGPSRTHDTATAWAKAISSAINWATGGTDYVPGVLSPTPDAIDYLISAATGGVGREVSKTAQVAQSLYTGTELPTHKIPLVGRFTGSATGSSSIRTRFYENVRQANMAYNEYEGRAKHHEPFSEYIKTHPEARFAKIAITIQKDLGILQKQKMAMLEKGAGREAVRLQEERITGLMKRFNDMIAEAQK